MFEPLRRRYLRFGHDVAFPRQLAFGVSFLRLFGDVHAARRLGERLRTLPEGTVGKALADFMDHEGLAFVPGYFRHDLKHVLLGYSTHPSDEMRMQAFMTGNAGWRRESFLALLFLPWTPDAWPDLPRHYRLGQRARPLSGLDLEVVVHLDLVAFRRSLGIEP